MMMRRTTMNNSEAINVLYRSGVLARSKDEEELLDWFRKLPPEAQRLEFARAQGMAQAMGYAMLEAQKAVRS
jgi:hypothetical protein